MIAANFKRFPVALLAQRELELVIAAGEVLTKADCGLIKKSIAANIAWVCEFTRERIKQINPGWFKAMRRRAIALAQAIRAACLNLI